MKIGKFTKQVLENFATINQTLLIKEGDVLETVTQPTITMKAKATVDTVFPKTFGVYNLHKLISILSLYKDPDVDFGESMLTISEGSRSSKLLYADKATVTKVPEKQLTIGKVDVAVKVTQDAMRDVNKALRVLGFEEVIISGDGKNVYLVAGDPKLPASDTHSITLGETDRVFKAVFKAQNLLLLPYDYMVEINKDGRARFTTDKLEYFVPIENETSDFGE
jgi:hypothetical protein